MLIVVVGFIAFLIIASQPTVDCDELMEQRKSILDSMKVVLDALTENTDTVTEEERTEGLTLVAEMKNAEDKIHAEWTSNCS